jgi:MFS transporter, YNFM family, putative membrane transport protein
MIAFFLRLARERRSSITAAAAGFTAFVNVYALQSLLPVLADAFQASSRAVSLAVSATTLAVALASPFAGWLVSRMTRGNIIKCSVGGLVFCGLQVALAQNLDTLLFWRFAQGLFLPILIAGVLSFIAQDFTPDKVGRATSNYVTWTIVGGFSGRWLGGFVCSVWGWREALLALSLANAGAGLVLIGNLSNPTARITSRTPPNIWDFLASFRQPELRAGYVIGFCSLFTMVGTFTYVTFHLAQAPFELGPSELGKIFFVYLLGITVTPMVGRLLPSWGVSCTVHRTSKLATLGLLLTLSSDLRLIILGLSLVCVAGFATQASVSTFIAHLPPRVKAVAAGLYLSAYYFGGCIGGALPGLLWEHFGWIGCVGLLVVAQVTVLRFSGKLSMPRRYCSSPEIWNEKNRPL